MGQKEKEALVEAYEEIEIIGLVTTFVLGFASGVLCRGRCETCKKLVWLWQEYEQFPCKYLAETEVVRRREKPGYYHIWCML